MVTRELISTEIEDHAPGRGGRIRPWAITAMLCAFMFINFADKAVLGLVAIPLSEEFGLSPAQYGELASSFFFLFTLSALLVGMLANRISTRWLLLAMALLWSVTQVPMIWTTSLAVVFASRIALGAAEGPAFGMTNHALQKWFDNKHLQVPASLLSVGNKVGSLVAAPTITWVILQFGWRHAFTAVVIAGLVWSLLWLVVGREGPINSVQASAGDHQSPAEESKVPYRRIFLSGTWLGGTLMAFASYFGFALATTWLPRYLSGGLNYSMTTAGNLLAVFWALGALLTFGASFVSQRLTLRGVATRWSRGAVGAAMVLVGGLAIFLSVLVSVPWASLSFLMLGLGAPSAVQTLNASIQGEICPMRQRGPVLGLSIGMATLGGVIAPMVMGFLVQANPDSLVGYQQTFMMIGTVCVLAAGVGLALINPRRDATRLLASS
ncbi:MFS transporter [Streptomyces sp. NPDC020792]|uniref:MFS transporter n=1 Tax=Streptomyces sp. NPDC020792 TaxID=3365089 RepID=UPI0037B8C4B7